MEVVFVALIYFVVLLITVIKPLWAGNKRQFWLAAGLLTAGFVILAFAGVGIYVPSPMRPVEYLVKIIFRME